MAKRLHFWHTSVFLRRKKKMLPYIRASHLVCIEETMQSTPVCQWKFWRVTAWRMQERLSFFSLSVPVFASKSLNGWHESEKREKQILKARKKKKKVLTVCELIFGGGKQCGERRGKVWSGERTCC